jgi:hypothetical protein
MLEKNGGAAPGGSAPAGEVFEGPRSGKYTKAQAQSGNLSLRASPGEYSEHPLQLLTMSTTFTPYYLGRAGEQLGWDAAPPAKPTDWLEDLALLKELMV